MKWQCGLLLSTILAAPALAQEPPATTVPQPVPASPTAEPLACPPVACPCPVESPCVPPGLFRNGPDTRGNRLSGNHNFVNFINWMSNPLQNIDPRAVTAMYPIFGSSWVSDTPPIPNGDFQLYGPGITIALSDRFAMGLNQGGYAVAHFSRNPILLDRLRRLDPLGRFEDIRTNTERRGWLNFGGFFQYTVIQDVENQWLLTAGLRWEAPSGSSEIFQGHGPVHLAPYLTAGKEFGQFHVLATTGYQFPVGSGGARSEHFYANIHIDRQCFGWLYPLVEFNSTYHSTPDVSLRTRRGFIDMGNFDATGTIVSLAAGANAVLVRERLEFGAVYTTVIASQRDFAADGILVKMTLRY